MFSSFSALEARWPNRTSSSECGEVGSKQEASGEVRAKEEAPGEVGSTQEYPGEVGAKEEVPSSSNNDISSSEQDGSRKTLELVKDSEDAKKLGWLLQRAAPEGGVASGLWQEECRWFDAHGGGVFCTTGEACR
mmetsp:Transcript_26150/g.62388  ORF Transcript_26150/g.62388 Transcript_26150/m.62388 type:complete len:134 (+) Transcript_26150:265-666(+)